jgi:hypothetical protein
VLGRQLLVGGRNVHAASQSLTGMRVADPPARKASQVLAVPRVAATKAAAVPLGASIASCKGRYSGRTCAACQARACSDSTAAAAARACSG